MEIMDCQHQKRRGKHDDYEEEEQGSNKGELVLQQTSASPASSPSHEFSFTISLQQQPYSSLATTSTSSTAKSTTTLTDDKSSKSSPPSFVAVDLSPADEIFFHGHLLPLHLLSHLPVSPRSSTNSLDSFTLPIKDLNDQDQSSSQSILGGTRNTISSEIIHKNVDNFEIKGRPTKSKSFSLFGLSSKWRKDQSNNVGDQNKEDRAERQQQKRKLKFDHVSHVLKRYMRMVRPLLSFGNNNKRGNNHAQFHRQAFSYSGNLSLRRKPELIGRRGEFSAPASMRTSPTNSGLLVAAPSGTLSPSCSTSDSTMEELQAAIQAAIAHCKNSIAMEEDKIIKCHHE